MNLQLQKIKNISYQKLLQMRAEKTQRILTLEASALAIRHSEKIAELDKERMKIHRQLEELGHVLGLSPIDVQMDILSFQFNFQDLGLVGMHAINIENLDLPSWGKENFDFFDDEEIVAEEKKRKKGILLVYDSTHTNLGWHGEGFEESMSKEFSVLLQYHAEKLCEHLTKNGLASVKIVEEKQNNSGVAHINESVYRGIFIPENNVKAVMSYLRTHKEEWILEKEYQEKKETCWIQKFENGDKLRLPGTILPKQREHLKQLFDRFQSTRTFFGNTYFSQTKKIDELPEDLYGDLVSLKLIFKGKEIFVEFYDTDESEEYGENFESQMRPLSEFLDLFEKWIEKREEKIFEIKREKATEQKETEMDILVDDVHAQYRNQDIRVRKQRM